MTVATPKASPVAALAAAEHQVAASILATANRIDQLGTDSIDHALARLNASVTACKARLAAAVAATHMLAGELVADLEGLADGLMEQLDLNDLSAEPVSVPLGVGVVSLTMPPAEPAVAELPAPPVATAEPTTEPTEEQVDLVAEPTASPEPAPQDEEPEESWINLADEPAPTPTQADEPIVSTAANSPVSKPDAGKSRQGTARGGKTKPGAPKRKR